MPKWAIICDGPDPFWGDAGQVLRGSLQRVGLDPVQAIVASTEGATTKELNALRPLLFSELEDVDVLLLLGNNPLKLVTGQTGVTKHRGHAKELHKDFPYKGEAYATVDPYSVVRNAKTKNEFLRDLAAFSQLVYPPVDSDEVVLVRTQDQLAEMLREMRTAKTGAVDIETTIGDVFKGEITLVTMAFTFDGERAWVLSYDHPEASQVGTQRDWDHFAGLFNQINWVMHNGLFDRLTLRQLTGGKLDPILKHDTMAMAYLLHEEERKGLEILSSVYLGEPPYKGVHYEEIKSEPLDKVALMNGKDALRTFRLYRPLADEMNENKALSKIYQWLLMPAVNDLITVTENGVPVDLPRLEELTRVKRLALEQELRDLQLRTPEKPGGWPRHKDPNLNKRFNPASTDQVRWVLFEVFGLRPVKYTEKGEPSTDQEALTAMLMEARGDAEEWIEALLRFRKVAKQLSAYLESWPELIDKQGYMHPRFKPLHVVTGRLSSERPNIQNVPHDKEFRDLFGGVPGHTWVKADYSQLELRLAAWMAGEERMLAAYQEGEDLHALTGLLVLGDSADPAARRYAAKPLNFGLLYGAGWRTLQRIARTDYGVRLSDDQAQYQRDAWFETYPAIAAWHERQRASIQRSGVSVSPLGRIRHLPDATYRGSYTADEDRARRANGAIREGINHPVQSFGSDLLLMAMHRVMQQLPPGARVVAEVHDEIDLIVPDDLVTEVGSLLKVTMEDVSWLERFGITLGVPLVAEVEAGSHWGSLTTLEV